MQGVAFNLSLFVAPALLCYNLVCTVAAKIKLNVLMRFVAMVQNSATGTRARVAWVRAEYPNQLDYSGSVCTFGGFLQHALQSIGVRCNGLNPGGQVMQMKIKVPRRRAGTDLRCACLHML